MTAGIVPITADERRARIAKAQRLMGRTKDRCDLHRVRIEHVLFHRGALERERAHVLRVSQHGELAWVCPKFEEERARELIKFGTAVWLKPHLGAR